MHGRESLRMGCSMTVDLNLIFNVCHLNCTYYMYMYLILRLPSVCNVSILHTHGGVCVCAVQNTSACIYICMYGHVYVDIEWTVNLIDHSLFIISLQTLQSLQS